MAEVSLGPSSPVAEATVEALAVANDQVVVSTTSAANGTFSVSVPTGGNPVSAYARITKTGYRRTYIYTLNPLSESLIGAPAPVVTPPTFQTLSDFASVTQDDATNGALLVLVSDCAGEPVNDAVVTVTQNGTSVGTLLNLTDASDGAYAFFNVPAGAASVNVTYDGTAFRPVDVKAYAAGAGQTDGTVTAVLVSPGYP